MDANSESTLQCNWDGFLNRLTRNFDDGVYIQAELTEQKIGIVTLRENIDTGDGSAAASFFRRSMLAQGACQVHSASERIGLGLDQARPAGNGDGNAQFAIERNLRDSGFPLQQHRGLEHRQRKSAPPWAGSRPSDFPCSNRGGRRGYH